jgi:hypothetical protein
VDDFRELGYELPINGRKLRRNLRTTTCDYNITFELQIYGHDSMFACLYSLTYMQLYTANPSEAIFLVLLCLHGLFGQLDPYDIRSLLHCANGIFREFDTENC